MYKHLYTCFKHWYELGGTIYIYSDPHFQDAEMSHLRKDYPGDDEQVALINKKVTKQDTLIILGDIGNKDFIRKIRAGKKILVLGNHDHGAAFYERNNWGYINKEKKDPITNKYVRQEGDNKLFDEIYEGTLQISPKIVLSHEPFESRYCLNIHGHDHSKTVFQDKKHLNVCAEHINYTPMCLKDIIESGILKDLPDIHRDAIDNNK